MMISKSKPLGLVGGILVGLALTTGLTVVFLAISPATAQGPAAPAAQAKAAAKQQDPNKALAQVQLKLARQALEEIDSLYQNSRMDILDSRVAVWERRRIEALQASGVEKREIVSALETYVKRMKAFAQLAAQRQQQAKIVHVDVLDWQYRALEGEMWLNQARLR
jgi:Spy/CpxP family protein refolding chaperone